MDMMSAATIAIKTLTDAGYEAFIVGGYTRDLLLGRKSKDAAVCTVAIPDTVISLFDKTIVVGRSFGVVVVIIDGIQIETATFRADAPTSADGRHPDYVKYSLTAREDVERRDFTINGLLLANETTEELMYPGTSHAFKRAEGFVCRTAPDGTEYEILDYVNGLADLDAKIIRCIGDPIARFTEDALRMLRAVRFAAQLGFEIEPATKAAIIQQAHTISKVSRERIKTELEKLLTGDFATRGIALLFSTGLAKHIFMHVDDFNVRDILERFERFHVLTPTTALAMFMASFSGSGDDAEGTGDGYLEDVLESLKLSNDECAELKGALSGVEEIYGFNGNLADLKRLGREPGVLTACLLLEQNMLLTPMMTSAALGRIEKLRSFTLEDLYPKPLVTGDDLLALGYAQGKQLGAIMKYLETLQLNFPTLTKEYLLDAVKRFDFSYVGGDRL